MDGMEEKSDGCLYCRRKKLNPRVERLLQLSLEARRAQAKAVKSTT